MRSSRHSPLHSSGREVLTPRSSRSNSRDRDIDLAERAYDNFKSTDYKGIESPASPSKGEANNGMMDSAYLSFVPEHFPSFVSVILKINKFMMP